jgi:hypothetical protein
MAEKAAAAAAAAAGEGSRGVGLRSFAWNIESVVSKIAVIFTIT